MSLGSRLLEFIKSLNMNPNQFGNILGLKSSENIRNLTNGKTSDPRVSLIIEILYKYPQLDARWLLTGEGDMTKTKYVNPPDMISTVNESDYNVNFIIQRLEKDKEELLNRLENQSEEIGRLKEKLGNT